MSPSVSRMNANRGLTVAFGFRRGFVRAYFARRFDGGELCVFGYWYPLLFS
jgi:hypothetical protein